MIRSEIDGHKLVVLPLESRQSGPPIILIHGVLVSVRGWTTSWLPFVKYGRCYSLSLPGHYPASFPPNFDWKNFSTSDFIHLMSEAIRDLAGNEPAILAGLSTGSMAALGVAARHPELVRGVVSISGFADGQLSSLLGQQQKVAQTSLGRRILRIGYAAFRWPPLYAWIWRLACARWKNFDQWKDSERFLRITHEDYQRADLRSIIRFIAALKHFNIQKDLKNIKCPVLIIAGKKDPIVSNQQTANLISAIPQATSQVFPDAGHLVIPEAQDEVNRILDRWLEATLAAG